MIVCSPFCQATDHGCVSVTLSGLGEPVLMVYICVTQSVDLVLTDAIEGVLTLYKVLCCAIPPKQVIGNIAF